MLVLLHIYPYLVYPVIFPDSSLFYFYGKLASSITRCTADKAPVTAMPEML